VLRGKTRGELLKLQQSFAVPMVVITHDPADVEAFAEDLIVFDVGKVARQISVETTRRASQVREVLGLD
jgi:molybdate transport system ATP-binding protein